MHTDAHFQKVWPVQCSLTVHGFDRKSILCLFTITVLRVSVPQIVRYDDMKLLFTCDDHPNITCLQVSSVKRTIGEAMSINEEMQLKYVENYVQLQYPNFELTLLQFSVVSLDLLISKYPCFTVIMPHCPIAKKRRISLAGH